MLVDNSVGSYKGVVVDSNSQSHKQYDRVQSPKGPTGHISSAGGFNVTSEKGSPVTCATFRKKHPAVLMDQLPPASI
jgi:hypothetical protein